MVGTEQKSTSTVVPCIETKLKLNDMEHSSILSQQHHSKIGNRNSFKCIGCPVGMLADQTVRKEQH